MKTFLPILACALATVLQFGPLRSIVNADSTANPPLLTQNFDEQVPGDTPSGWSKLWGEQGDDTFVIDNQYAVSGKQCLLLDRQSGTNVKMWGFGKPLPSIDDGWYVTQFDLLVDGAGSDIAAGFELRQKGGGNDKAFAVELNGFDLKLCSSDWKQTVTLAKIDAKTWYRVTVWAPTANGKQDTAYATIESRSGADWKALGPSQSVHSAVPKDGYGYLEVNTAPNKRNFRLYIDDLSVQCRTGNHP
ncbi:MAG: hypothetical protein P4L33_09785 [Capsulimonadaceae bacterium]|nr:hypothetical protein [Capsulimonadaceae bacterium]